MTALGLIALYQPKMREKMMAGIEASVKVVTGAKSVSPTEINELLSTGKATINGKEVTSTAKFYRLAFGECLNTPSYGIDLGVVTSGGKSETVKDGSSMSGSHLVQREESSFRTRTTLDSTNLSLFGGRVSSPKSEPPSTTTTPGKDPDPVPDPAPVNPETRPGADRGGPVPSQPGVAPTTPTSGPANNVGVAAPSIPGATPAPAPGA